MMKNLIKSIPLFLVMIITMSSFVGDKSVKLRINLSEGSQINTEMTMEVVTFSMDLGPAGGSEIKMSFKINQNVESKEGDNYKMKSIINAMSMDMSTGGMDVSYDSENYDSSDPIQAEMHASISELIGKPIIEVVNNKGQSVGEPDFSAFTAEMVEAMKLDEIGENLNFVLPEEDVKVGDSWTAPREAESGGLLTKVNVVYTVKEIKKNEVLLDVSGDISGEGVIQGIDATMTGTQTGTAIVNRKYGICVSNNVVQNANMVMSMQGEEINMTLTTDVRSKSEVKQ